MKNDNDQYSSHSKTSQDKKRFEILQAQILLFHPMRKESKVEEEVLSFSNDKILTFKTAPIKSKSHLRLVQES